MSDTMDNKINRVLDQSTPYLLNLFHEKFGEEVESESMLELIVSLQLHIRGCIVSYTELE